MIETTTELLKQANDNTERQRERAERAEAMVAERDRKIAQLAGCVDELIAIESHDFEMIAALKAALAPFVTNARVITDEWARRTYGDGKVFSRTALDENGDEIAWGFTIDDVVNAYAVLSVAQAAEPNDTQERRDALTRRPVAAEAS
jgi:hypothetical protein